MANKSISMEVKGQIKLLNDLGYGKKTIAKELGLSKNTVKSYLSEDDRSSVNKAEDKKTVLFDFFPYVQQELERTGVTRQILWGEYRARNPDGYSYTQFCDYLHKWLSNQDVSLHIEQVVGDKMYIDYAGKKLTVADPATGEIKEVEVFVSVLGYSGKTYVRATWSQRKEDFFSSIVHALNYYGGVPRVLVPDNIKTGVDKASNYEADINRSLLDLGNHYGIALMPTRSRKPRDKAWVERMVQIIYTRIYAPLRNRVFTSIEELNDAILELLEEHNSLSLQGRKESRNDLFLSEEKSVLQPLPQEIWELKDYCCVKVMKNCHVQLYKDRHYYSVPYKYIGQKIKLVYTSTYVSIYHGSERIAYHLRDRREHKYTTVKEHLPSSHQFVSEWNPSKFIEWAGKIDPSVKSYIEKVLENKSYPEQTYRSCAGILSFDKKAGRDRLIAACHRASEYGVYNYKVIEQIINNKLDRIESRPEIKPMPIHGNIRGAEYYQ